MLLVIAVFATWIVVAALCVGVGQFAAATIARPMAWTDRTRVALWTGLSLVVLYLAAMNLVFPMKSPAVALGAVAMALGSIVVAIIIWKRRATSGDAKAKAARSLWVLVPILTLLIALVVIAHSFAGPVDNWDAGLYQLNSIQYAAEYRIIPGLANLHDRLGTNMATSLIAAALSASPWGIDAFRLLVGLFACLAVADVVLRLLSPKQVSKVAPGLVASSLGVGVALAFLLQSPGTWVTSPTPDSVSMLLVIVAAGYLVDAVWSRSVTWSVVAILVSFVAATVRTQLWVFAGLVLIVLVVRLWRRPSGSRLPRRSRAFALIGAIIAAGTIVVMMIRDAILSGWLLFPASALPLPVDWRVPDPAASRAWILSWAREPGAAPEDVLNSWHWLWPWVGRTSADWSVRAALGLLALALVLWIVGRSVKQPVGFVSSRVGLKGLILALVPIVCALGVWFWTAPDPRFAWGPLVALGVAPVALVFAGLGAPLPDRRVFSGVAAGIMCFLVLGPAVSGLVQIRGFIAEGFEWRTYAFGQVAFIASINPVETPAVAEFTLDDGSVILTPTEHDKCQLTFPLCRPYPDPTLQFRGTDIESGFRSARLVQ